MNQLFYITGMPRSGSTLLCNILAQNPNHYVTPTSGLIELFMNVQRSWPEILEFKTEGLGVVKPRIKNALKGLMYGYFEKEFSENKVAFDKSRGWLNHIEDLEQVLGKEVKMLVTVRDVRSVVASFERLYRNRDIEWKFPRKDYVHAQTTVDRSNQLLSNTGPIGISINRIRDAIERKSNRLIIIPYSSLTQNPQETMKVIHKVLGLESYTYDCDNVKQITKENDLLHGMDLHHIRPKIEPEVPESWKDVLSDTFANSLNSKYMDINRLASPGSVKK